MQAEQLATMLREVRARTLELVADLSDQQMIGPQLRIVNPPLWETGHIAWFQEKWVLRELRGQPPTLENGDELYDSAEVAHDTRWELLLPNRAGTLAFMQDILDKALSKLDKEPSADEAYFYQLAALHEAMHAEAITYS